MSTERIPQPRSVSRRRAPLFAVAAKQQPAGDVRPLATKQTDLAAIAHNVRTVHRRAGTPLMAVVKADAFGHGAVDVARVALRNGASWLGTATVDEAIALRRAGVTAPVLSWLVDPWCDLDAAVAASVTVSCADMDTVVAVDAATRRRGVRVDVHLELDTDMARGGASADMWDALCGVAARAGHLRVEGVWSHLATAGDPSSDEVGDAVDRFRLGVRRAATAGLTPSVLHIANSAAALAHPETRFSLARIGAALYGIETVDGRTHGLRPALRVASRATQVRRVDAGTGVGYHHAYRTTRSTTLALIPVGFADGVPRAVGQPVGGDPVTVSIRGRRHPIVGTVSMDQLVVDVGAGDVRVGDEVVLLGTDVGEPTATEWAAATGTVPHEILTGFGARIARLDPGVASATDIAPARSETLE